MIFIGIVINVIVCGVMLKNKCVLKNLLNFFVFYLFVVDLIFWLLIVGFLIYLSIVFSVEEGIILCKLLYFFFLVCGVVFFVLFLVIFVDVYCDVVYFLKGFMLCCMFFVVVFVVWLYVVICSGLLMYSV